MPTLTPSELVPGVWPVEGEALVYLVDSDSRPGEPYRVDLRMYGGHGCCGCMDFVTRKQTHLANGAAPREAWECKHIRRAKRYYLWERLTAEIALMEMDETKMKAQSQKQSAARAVERRAEAKRAASGYFDAEESEVCPF